MFLRLSVFSCTCLLVCQGLFQYCSLNSKVRGHTALCRGKLFGLCPHPLLVVHSVLTVYCVSFCLGRILYVGFIKKLLDTQQDLLDGDGRPPVLIFLQDGQTDGARRVDIWVKDGWFKLAFWRRGWVVIFKQHPQFILASFPKGPLFPWNSTFPVHEVESAIRVLGGNSNKTKWVVFSPGFALLRQSTESDS
uniref:Uncharacterized protein n=1 Tax=Anguilla anguilla TaxID=7936 RepID=A0A0E9XE24_ANGAN